MAQRQFIADGLKDVALPLPTTPRGLGAARPLKEGPAPASAAAHPYYWAGFLFTGAWD